MQKIVELGGRKFEINFDEAKEIQSFKVGDNVKVLIKQWSDSWKSFPGVIVAADPFEKLPTITILYLDDAEAKIAMLNEKSDSMEICRMTDEELLITREDLLEKLDRRVAKAEEDLRIARNTRDLVLKRFEAFLSPAINQQ